MAYGAFYENILRCLTGFVDRDFLDLSTAFDFRFVSFTCLNFDMNYFHLWKTSFSPSF